MASIWDYPGKFEEEMNKILDKWDREGVLEEELRARGFIIVDSHLIRDPEADKEKADD